MSADPKSSANPFASANPFGPSGMFNAFNPFQQAGQFQSPFQPTMDPADLDKRIADLRTVEHWLDFNLTLLRGTIQTLEMQRASLQAFHDLSAAFRAAGQPSPADPQAAPPAEGAARHTGMDSSGPDAGGAAPMPFPWSATPGSAAEPPVPPAEAPATDMPALGFPFPLPGGFPPNPFGAPPFQANPFQTNPFLGTPFQGLPWPGGPLPDGQPAPEAGSQEGQADGNTPEQTDTSARRYSAVRLCSGR